MKLFRNLSIKMKLGLGFGTMVPSPWPSVWPAGWVNGPSPKRRKRLPLSMKSRATFRIAAGREEFRAARVRQVHGDTKSADERLLETAAEVTRHFHDTPQRSLQGRTGNRPEAASRVQGLHGRLRASGRARKVMDLSAEAWKKTGVEFLAASAAVKETLIDPAVKAAQAANNVAEIAKWVPISWSFSEDFMQAFTLLRVQAVYYLGSKGDVHWEDYQKQKQAVAAGLTAFDTVIHGHDALVGTVAKLNEV